MGEKSTIGITLRLPRVVLAEYSKMALAANELLIKQGKRPSVTPQDVMRRQLQSLPQVAAILEQKGHGNDG